MTETNQSTGTSDAPGIVPPGPPIPRPPIPRPPIPSPGPAITELSLPTLGGAVGSDFRSALNQLLFVEFSGNLSRIDLFPDATVVSSGTTVLNGTWTFDLDTGTEGGVSSGADIFWEQMTTVDRQMASQNGAGLFNLGAVDFATLSAAGLQKLPYSTAPIPGNDDPTNKLVNGDVFAVRTQAGNFAKVMVVAYGYDLTMEWVTYELTSFYQVLGTGYEQPEDVKASNDGTHVYVTERAGNLLKVDLASAERASATVVATGMTAPQQLFLDENASAAYTVEYAPSGSLWRIDLTTGAKTAVVTGLENAVGITLSLDRQFAYISEQTTGPDGGRVSRFQLSNGQRIGLATGLTAPFFLTWADSSQDLPLLPRARPGQRPGNRQYVRWQHGGRRWPGHAAIERRRCESRSPPGVLRPGDRGDPSRLAHAATGRTAPPEHRIHPVRLDHPRWSRQYHGLRPELLLPGDRRAFRRLAARNDQLPPGRP